MTWLADVQKDRPSDSAREKLLKQREKLIAEIEALKKAPISRSVAAAAGRVEDLTALAKKVTAIDRRLGRIE